MDDAQREAARCDQRAGALAHGRTAAFLLAAVPLALSVWGDLPRGGWALAVPGALAYAVLAALHDRTLKAEARARARTELCRRSLARRPDGGGGWHQFPDRGDRFGADPDHDYSSDLNLFGQGSLFQLLDETATSVGEERLAGWLKAPALPTEVLARQSMVRELEPRTDFRQDLQSELELLRRRSPAGEKSDPAAFVAWAEAPPDLQAIRWARFLAWPLPLLTLGLFVLGRLEWVPRPLFWGSLLAQLAVAAVCARPLGRLYRGVASREGRFRRYEESFSLLEGATFEQPDLQRVAGLGAGAFKGLRRFGRLFAFAELRQSAQLHAAMQVLTLWDLHWLFRIEDWRREYGARVRSWFSALAEIEALLSFAGFAHDHPAFTYPRVVESGGAPEARLEARGLGHPLLDAPVVNDLGLGADRRALVITGSNMSGKSTLIRSLGLNAVLAQAGAPVCASALTLSPLRVFTSMRLSDSLERGVSYFHAEVRRLKSVLDGTVAAKGAALFLLDEILLGTNARERQIASRQVLELLLGTGAIGAVTTHDLSLTELAREPGLKISNVHFRDLLVDGRMSFDYRMLEGVADSTNALRVLRQAGIPVQG